MSKLSDRLSLFILCLAVPGCGKLSFKGHQQASAQPPAVIAAYTALQNPQTAPEAIKQAADAVVKIVSLYGGSGSGSFISADGLLMTNNHVMGSEVCAAAGCYFEIEEQYQADNRHFKGATKVFGVPQFASAGLDVAILQLYASKGGAKYQSPHFLTFEAKSSAQLVGTQVTIVGHPHSALKKWSVGDVYEQEGDWFRTTTLTLGGNSGSPVLNDAGKIVGIIHRLPDRAESITASGLETYSVCTSSQAILDAYKPGSAAALPAGLFVDVTQAQTDAVVAREPQVFYNARASLVKQADGTSRDILAIYGPLCDQALQQTSFESLEDMNSKLTTCSAATAWINCHEDLWSSSSLCPNSADTAAWLARADKLAALQYAFNNEVPYRWLTFAAAFETSAQSAKATRLRNVSAFLTAHQVPLDPAVAYNLVAYANHGDTPTYQGTDLTKYLLNAKQLPHYSYFAVDILYGQLILANIGKLTEDEGRASIREFLADPTLSLPDHLTVERSAFTWGAL